MIRFCPHCGKELEPGNRFCPFCGKEVQEIKDKTTAGTSPSAPAGGKSPSGARNKILAGGLIALILLGGGAFYFQRQKAQDASQAAAIAAQEAKQETKEKPADKQDAKDSIAAVQEILDREGLPGKVMATSYGHDPNGSLSVIGGKGRRLLVIDGKNHQKAFVDATTQLYHFINHRTGNLPSVIFQMRVLDEKPGDDEKAGYWDGTSHVIPIYAQYSFDGDGKVVPGMLNTGRGGRPSHYHDYLKEQRHVDLANLVLTEMQALHENADAHNIKL